MIKRNDDKIIRYIHGSEDSTDVDVIYVFDALPGIDDCKHFCDGNGNENGNIIIVKNGVVASAFKGSVDEVNNALFYTYPLHSQEFPLIIQRPVERDIMLKDIKVVRKILSSFSRTQFRCDIKEALRSGWGKRLNTLKNLDYNSIDFSSIPKTSKDDLLKTLAFQIGQAIALHEGIELYTKRSIADYFPELRDYLYRVVSSSDVIIKFIHRYVSLLEELPVKTIDKNIIRVSGTPEGLYNLDTEEKMH